jgi:hypothetical protein
VNELLAQARLALSERTHEQKRQQLRLLAH